MHDRPSMMSDDEEEEEQDNNTNDADTDNERETRSWSIDRLIEEQKWEALLKRLNTSSGKEQVRRRRQSTNNSFLRCCLLKTDIPYDIILTLLQICPEDAQQVDDRSGELPLHLACRNKYILQPSQQQQQQLIQSVTTTSCSSSSVLIKALIDAFPEGVQHRDSLGRTPLYRACCVGAPFNVIHEVLKAWPEGARTPTLQGAYPIHGVFCYRGDKGDTSLDVEVIQALLKEFPEGAQHGTMGSSHLPLHTACTRANTSLNVIKALVDAYPDGTKQMDGNNNLPLHFACLYGCSYDVIDFLIQQYPKGITQTTIAGNLPLHLSCQRTKTLVEVHSLLVQKYPEGVKISNKRGCLPIHIVCEQAKASSGLGHHVEKIQSLLNVYPEGALHYDEYGNLPINSATFLPTSIDVFCALLQAYPSGAGHFNDHGSLPLHSVCLWDDSSDDSTFVRKLGAIQTLVEAYKDGLTMVTKKNEKSTPLKLILIQAKKCEDKKTSKRFEHQQRIIEYLVHETYPSHGLTDHKNEKSSFPVLHSAVRGDAPLDIIEDLCDLFPAQLHTKDAIMGRLPLHFALAGAPVVTACQDRHDNLFRKIQVALHLIHAYSQASDKEDPICSLVPFVSASLMASHLYHSKNNMPKTKNVEDTDTKERKDTHKGSGKKNTFHQDDLTVVETLFLLLRYNPCAAIVVDYS